MSSNPTITERPMFSSAGWHISTLVDHCLQQARDRDTEVVMKFDGIYVDVAPDMTCDEIITMFHHQRRDSHG